MLAIGSAAGRLLVVGAFLAGTVGAWAQVPPGSRSEHSGASTSATIQPYQPITATGRVNWFVRSTVGPRSRMTGLLSAGVGTALNNPIEYGPSRDGFGACFGMCLTGVSTGNAIEASLGTLWGEDPRYFRTPGEPIGTRVWHIIKMTFAAPREDGHLAPAYARYVAIPGNNFLSHTWRVDSESHLSDAAVRTIWGVLSRMGSNAFSEFWPDVVGLFR